MGRDADIPQQDARLGQLSGQDEEEERQYWSRDHDERSVSPSLIISVTHLPHPASLTVHTNTRILSLQPLISETPTMFAANCRDKVGSCQPQLLNTYKAFIVTRVSVIVLYLQVLPLVLMSGYAMFCKRAVVWCGVDALKLRQNIK